MVPATSDAATATPAWESSGWDVFDWPKSPVPSSESYVFHVPRGFDGDRDPSWRFSHPIPADGIVARRVPNLAIS